MLNQSCQDSAVSNKSAEKAQESRIREREKRKEGKNDFALHCFMIEGPASFAAADPSVYPPSACPPFAFSGRARSLR
ncbi:hypothetical protein MRB53_027212 [Persea americana]|uniref:Uncharacterized protein n=1 Tax=Persea americana TaxID=3435 RepID=A0ACC2LLH8_PERAE|nr:hypothetical protein MRB53_027212 [Persea americana]